MEFIDTSQQYLEQISNTRNELFQYIFSKFKFLTFHSKTHIDNENDYYQTITDFLYEYLKSSNFIIYDIQLPKENLKLQSNQNSEIYNFIFCIEGECIIIENICLICIQNLINKLINQQISIINISNINKTPKANEIEAREEINNFCINYRNEIKNNTIIKYLLPSLIGYLIRRYYYPSEYFKDPSFFNFNESIQKNEQKIKSEINNFLRSKGNNKQLILKIFSISNEISKVKKVNNKIIEFNKDEFVFLRNINCTKEVSFDLVLYIKNFYIFMMKRIHKDEFQHEIDFCKKYSHRCLTKFYGFLKEKDNIIGLIYEFQCNGTISSYKQIDDMFSLITIYRLFEAIEYLHSKSLIHRDLKPSNILINHDNLPFISDFDTVRCINDEQNNEFTENIGSQLYSSPEQDKNSDNMSYPTDIYSFGLIIYYLFEKHDMWPLYVEKKDENVKKMTKGSQNIQNLYKKCVCYDQEKRISKEEIKNILKEEFDSFYYLEEYILNSLKTINNSKINEFIYDKIEMCKSSFSSQTNILLFRIIIVDKNESI